MHDGRLEEGSYSLGGKEVIPQHPSWQLLCLQFFQSYIFFLSLVMDLRQIKTKT